MKIAIQGIKGSLHHIAATNFFGKNVSLSECISFSDIPELIIKDIVDNGIMAIENSIGGPILPNYHLIDSHNLNILGEIYLPMVHNLMTLPGQCLKDLKEVWSHPIAIQHCHKFFRLHPEIRIIEEKDTANVARMIREDKLKGIATIASKKAAEIYGLEILEEEIQVDLLNMTRYFIISKQRKHLPEDYLNNKASLKFITQHQSGNLSEILTIFNNHNLNISKIQSIPNTKEPWNSSFFIDITFEDYHDYCQALLTLEKQVVELKILGEYSQSNPILG